MKCQRAFLRHSTSKIRDSRRPVSYCIFGIPWRGAFKYCSRHPDGTDHKDSRCRCLVPVMSLKVEKKYPWKIPVRQMGQLSSIHQLFYNVPARRKFLKTPMTEAGHVQDLLMHLALSHPEVAFQFLNNGQEKLAYFRKRKTERCDLQCLWP